MIDLAYIRENPEAVRQAMLALHAEAPIDEILALDEMRRTMLVRVEELRAERNRVSKDIPRIKDKDAKQSLIAQMRQVGAEIKEIDAELGPTEAALRAAQLSVPNLPDASVPVGPDEDHNIITRVIGEKADLGFEPKPHWDLGTDLDIIDFDRGVKISGSRFYVLKGLGARLQRAVIAWMLQLHTEEHGYTEVYTPFVVRGVCLEGTAQLPKFGDNLYRDHKEDLWLVPTAEVPVTNLYREEILAEEDLPIKHTAYTACFRREQMSAGRDTRGIKRGHQFDKVEMVKFVRPENSMAELETLLADAEDTCRQLGLAYRVVQMCTGDLSFSAAVKYDVEVWAPGCGEWLEVSSCSNFCAFQARRAGIRYRPTDGGRPRFVHTLNGSGLGMPRTMIAIMENYQQADGSIVVPEVLRPFMGGAEVIR